LTRATVSAGNSVLTQGGDASIESIPANALSDLAVGDR
jgi:hypothetical protein